MLQTIKNTDDIKKLTLEQLEKLARDIRRFLIKSIASTGGHLASNLGTVELTVALHYVYNSPEDKIIWDVGHQAYTHKILTGRQDKFSTLRQADGLSGFLKRTESPHDVFETGHSSTSISAALGMATARDLKGEHNHVLAVIGDASLTGGMAFEALNHAGRSFNNLVVILNDNEMSISYNVGGMSKYLTKLRSTKEYATVKQSVSSALYQIPKVGDSIVSTAKRMKEILKLFIMPATIFDEMGFRYLGPVDGHNLEDLIYMLESAKQLHGPILIHVKTIKGKGCSYAQKEPAKYHGVTSYNYKTGEMTTTSSSTTFSASFGDAIVKLATTNKKVVAISAAMIEGTGLVKFSTRFPGRCFDVGIAEQHGVTFAAGMSTQGFHPVVAIYSSFLQRAYDQILHDVGLQNLPVVFAIDRAGLVGEDGPTHQGIFDIAFLAHIPNMQILSPKLPCEVESALAYGLSKRHPVAIRYPKGTTISDLEPVDYMKDIAPRLHLKGRKAIILATGKAVILASKVRTYLMDTYKIELALAEVPCIAPVDTDALVQLLKRYSQVITIEDHILIGGFGSIITNALQSVGVYKKYTHFGYKTGIIEHGEVDVLLQKHQLTPRQIGEAIKEKLG